MADNVIKEFLVSLGFKVDEPGLKKVNEGITAATSLAVAMGEALYHLAETAVEAVGRIIPQFDQLYWQSQRLGSSASDIRGFGYALSQLGGSAQGAQALLENIAEFTKSNPGAQGFLARLGVDPKNIGDAAATAKDLERTFQSMPYYRAKAFGSVIGVDPLTLQAMLRDTGKFEAEYKGIVGRVGAMFGMSMKDATATAKDAQQEYRRLGAEFSLAFEIGGLKLVEYVLPLLKQFEDWAARMSSGKQLDGISLHLRDMIQDVKDLLAALEKLASTPAIQRFGDEMVSAVEHALKAVVNLIRLVTDVLNGDWKAARRDAGAMVSQAGQAAGAVGTGVGDLAAGAAGAFRKNVPENAQASYKFFRSQGMTDVQARGTVAMLFSESHLNPDAVNPSSGARGIGQWLGSRAKEFQSLFHHDLAHSTFNEQLQFVVHELKHGEKKAWERMKGGLSAFAVANEGIHSYERPGFAGELGDGARAAALLSSDIFTAKLTKVADTVATNAAALKKGAATSALVQNADQAAANATALQQDAGSTRLGTGDSSNVNINQKTDIHVHGEGGKQTADEVAGHQDSVNQRMVSNASVFAY